MIVRLRSDWDACMREVVEAERKRDELVKLRKERDEARAVLKENEWCGVEVWDHVATTELCLSCKAWEEDGHAPDCKWQKAMGE